MYSKLSMKLLDRSSLSEHELKRCRAVAKGQHWQVWQEDVLWWSLDRQSWLPLVDSLWQRRRRWLMVETEEGVVPAMLWEVGHSLGLPPSADSDPEKDAAGDLAEIF